MNFLGIVWIPRCAQPAFTELAKKRVNVIGRDANCLTELPVPTMARKNESVSVAREDAERGIIQIVIAIHMLEIEYACVKCERSFHVAASNGWDYCHKSSFRAFIEVYPHWASNGGVHRATIACPSLPSNRRNCDEQV